MKRRGGIGMDRRMGGLMDEQIDVGMILSLEKNPRVQGIAKFGVCLYL